MIRIALLIGTILITGLVLVQLFPAAQSNVAEYRTSVALAIPLALDPRWIGAPCVEMDGDEAREEALALQVLRETKTYGRLHHGAWSELGSDHYRTEGKATRRTCGSETVSAALAEVTVAKGMFKGEYLGEELVRLARRIGPRDPAIVNAVARTAFNKYPILESFRRADIRPLARITLAEFGDSAKPWAQTAFDATNADDQLGTSAAAIAVAAGHPTAMEKVSTSLKGLLSWTRDPISRDTRDRFYELAYALAIAGPKARPYIEPVLTIMSRKVNSAAPPFGLVQLPPRRMCRVLEIIGGARAEEARSGEVCHPKVDVFEQ